MIEILLLPVLVSLVIGGALQASFHFYHVVTKPKQLAVAMDLAKVAVEAAEHDGKLLKLTSPEKYQRAKLALDGLASSVGMKLTDNELYAIIHSTLFNYEAVDVF